MAEKDRSGWTFMSVYVNGQIICDGNFSNPYLFLVFCLVLVVYLILASIISIDAGLAFYDSQFVRSGKT